MIVAVRRLPSGLLLCPLAALALLLLGSSTALASSVASPSGLSTNVLDLARVRLGS